MVQRIITPADNYRGLDEWMASAKCQSILLVCDGSIRFLSDISRHLSEIDKSGVRLIRFSDFQPNPLYESVVEGVQLFHKEKCKAIIAIGGGSAIDVAKCIKLYSNMDISRNFLEQEIIPNDIPFLVMPTTAGTGSEATRYAVIYYQDAKQSVTHESCIPDTVLMDSSALRTLPLYQKKSTMLDALCHSIESFWSVNSTDESKAYSKDAIRRIMANMNGYLQNEDQANAEMLMAANIAGKAINIAQTTAGHAMCYKLTTLYGIAHGHAAALCVRALFPWMLKNTDKCVDARGQEYLMGVFKEIAQAMDCNTPEQACAKLDSIVKDLQLSVPTASESDYELLKTSVNPTRLKNHPIRLDSDTIDMLYHRALYE